jgi:hypothetical protein
VRLREQNQTDENRPPSASFKQRRNRGIDMNVNSIFRRDLIGALAGALLLPLASEAQNCALPAMPDATVTRAAASM